MTEYVPQVGDKVSIEGEVIGVFGGFLDVRFPNGNPNLFCPSSSLTLVSRARPAWTHEPGALGIDREGDVWMRARGSDRWGLFGDDAIYTYDGIPQPLRRLVPEDER